MRVLDDKKHHEVEVTFLVATIILRYFPVGLFWTKKCSDTFFFPWKRSIQRKLTVFLCPIIWQFWAIADAGLTSQIS